MKILSVFKKTFLACALLAAVAGCSKEKEEEEEGVLTGKWAFRELNYIFHLNGVSLDAKEEGDLIDLAAVNAAWRTLTFTFGEDGNVIFQLDGDSEIMGTYTTAKNRVSMTEGEKKYSFTYRITGDTLEWTWDSTVFKMAMGGVPAWFHDFDDVDTIMTFTRVNQTN
jgi:hypothetical protein